MSPNQEKGDFLGPVWVYVVALGLFFLRFGYGYGLADQDEIIPYLYHLLDPSLLSEDWFVQTQLEGSVRAGFVHFLLPFCRAFPLEEVFAVFYLLLWLAIGAGAFHLLRAFNLGRVAAAGAVVVSLGILHKWTLGSNDLVYSMLVPEMAAWALALPAVRLYVSLRPERDGGVRDGESLARTGGFSGWWAILLGVATWFQLLVGILVFGCLFLEQIWELARSNRARRDWRRALISWLLFVLFSLPAVGPILMQQFQSPSTPDDPSIFYILAPFRNPIHHMLLSFPVKSVVRFLLITAAAGFGLHRLVRVGLVRHEWFLWRLGAIILTGCLVMFVFTEWIPVLLVAKFQIYKLTVLFKLLALGIIGAVFVAFLPKWLSTGLDRWLARGPARVVVTVVVVGLVAALWILLPGPVDSRLIGKVHRESDLGRMERWISANTDRTDVFAIPPSNSSFRSNARRGIVVNFMAFPYNDRDMVEWFRRIQSMAPVGRPETGLHVRPQLDYAFEHLGAAELKRLAREYGFEYVLRQTTLEEFETVERVGNWTLYRVE